MTKHELTKKFLEAQKAVEAARDTLNTAMKDLKKVEKLIDEQAKKPKMICKDGKSFEIIEYRVCNDGQCVEFKTDGGTYMGYMRANFGERSFPSETTVFKSYSFVNKQWGDRNYIDHIELLEGVNEYDKNRKL